MMTSIIILLVLFVALIVVLHISAWNPRLAYNYNLGWLFSALVVATVLWAGGISYVGVFGLR